MSLALVQSRALLGLQAPSVTVEVHLANGLPSFTLVGLADVEVKEARERVRSALLNAGLEFPHNKRITVNLAPADLPKDSGRFDLPIALGILAASGQIDGARLAGHEFAGELSLSGALRPVRGALATSLALQTQKVEATLVLPPGSAEEAALVPGAQVVRARHLLDVVRAFMPTDAGALADGTDEADEDGWCRLQPTPMAQGSDSVDMADVKGQAAAKRALEIAAAGGHSLLLVGPPGAGKSLLASCLPGILPDLTAAEALEVSMVASVAGTLEEGRISRSRPFRSPHHSASMAALTGGGLRVKPGEVSLAHLGVLFLDELPEFQRAVLDSLRQPLETGVVDVARANAHVTFPARVQLVAAMNPCRCGHLGDPALGCSRAPRCAADYQSKVSGPLLDRIDLHVEVDPVSAADLALPPPAEGSAEVAARVAAARQVQTARLAGTGRRSNAELDGDLLEAHATPDEAGRKLLLQAAEAMRLSARGYTRMLRVARTIADLAGSEGVGRIHIAEALSYRRVAPRA
jgi:magnesium chelatase family protein